MSFSFSFFFLTIFNTKNYTSVHFWRKKERNCLLSNTIWTSFFFINNKFHIQKSLFVIIGAHSRFNFFFWMETIERIYNFVIILLSTRLSFNCSFAFFNRNFKEKELYLSVINTQVDYNYLGEWVCICI